MEEKSEHDATILESEAEAEADANVIVEDSNVEIDESDDEYYKPNNTQRVSILRDDGYDAGRNAWAIGQ